MPIDPSIALGVRPVQLPDPTEMHGRMLALRDLTQRGQANELAIQQAKRENTEATTLADLYRTNVNPDGSVNYEGLRRGMASSGLGAKIPAVQKTEADARESATKARAAELAYAKQKLDVVNGSFAALLARPNLTHDDVVATISGWVDSGVLSPEEGAQRVRELPGPNGLRPFLTEKALQALDASKRLDAVLPKLERVDTGGAVQMVDTNPLTRGDAPTALPKTATPGERLNDAREREFGSKQFVPVEGVGVFVGDRRTGTATPVTDPQGNPIRQNKALTDSQAKANLFGTRAQEADSILAGLATQGTNQPSLAQQLTGDGALGMAANAFASPAQQRVSQAQRDFINAVLRRESGAVIADTEFANAQMQYFPKPGDSPEVIAQKAQNRRVAIEGILAEVPEGRRGVPSAAAPAAGAAEAAPGRAAPPVPIKSDADYNALPSGTRFLAPDGTTRVKP